MHFIAQNAIWLIPFVLIVIFASLAPWFSRFTRQEVWIWAKLWLGLQRGVPLLFASDVAGVGADQLTGGIIAGMPYSLLSSRNGRVMILVEMPKSTGVHFAALGAQSQRGQLLAKRIRNSVLSPVHLEGDYDKYFHLYCDPNKEIELRQVFDPASMAYLADFCSSYDIELLDNTLYVAQAQKAHDNTDTTTLVKDVENILTRHGQLFTRL